MIEKYGSGIRRVLETMADANAEKPVFETIGNIFKVTLFPVGTRVSGGVSGGVSELLDFIKSNPGKNSRELKELLNLSQRTVERRLKELKEQDQIVFKGIPRKGGYYIVKEYSND